MYRTFREKGEGSFMFVDPAAVESADVAAHHIPIKTSSLFSPHSLGRPCPSSAVSDHIQDLPICLSVIMHSLLSRAVLEHTLTLLCCDCTGVEFTEILSEIVSRLGKHL